MPLDSHEGEGFTLAERFATLAAEVRHLRQDVTDVESEQRRTRQRLHDLETSDAAANAARAALASVEVVKERTFTRHEKIAGLIGLYVSAFASVGALVIAVVALRH